MHQPEESEETARMEVDHGTQDPQGPPVNTPRRYGTLTQLGPACFAICGPAPMPSIQSAPTQSTCSHVPRAQRGYGRLACTHLGIPLTRSSSQDLSSLTYLTTPSQFAGEITYSGWTALQGTGMAASQYGGMTTYAPLQGDPLFYVAEGLLDNPIIVQVPSTEMSPSLSPPGGRRFGIVRGLSRPSRPAPYPPLIPRSGAPVQPLPETPETSSTCTQATNPIPTGTSASTDVTTPVTATTSSAISPCQAAPQTTPTPVTATTSAISTCQAAPQTTPTPVTATKSAISTCQAAPQTTPTPVTATTSAISTCQAAPQTTPTPVTASPSNALIPIPAHSERSLIAIPLPFQRAGTPNPLDPRSPTPSEISTVACTSGTQAATGERPRNVLLIKSQNGEARVAEFVDILNFLMTFYKNTVNVFITTEMYNNPAAAPFLAPIHRDISIFRLGNQIDIIISVDGDKAMTYISAIFQDRAVPPVLSFTTDNCLLSPFSIQTYQTHIVRTLIGRYPLRSRDRLQAEIVLRTGETLRLKHVLNNVIILCDGMEQTLTLDVKIDGRDLHIMHGSLIRIAKLKESRSMPHPEVRLIIISLRQKMGSRYRWKHVTVPMTSKIEVQINRDYNGEAKVVMFDGMDPTEVRPGDVLNIELSPFPYQSFVMSDAVDDWYSTVNCDAFWQWL